MNGPEKLRLVSVCDQETGVCLFQRAWQWRGDQERSSIGNLVQSFYQFAREVDQGEISCVNFLVQSSTHRRVSSSQATRRAVSYGIIHTAHIRAWSVHQVSTRRNADAVHEERRHYRRRIFRCQDLCNNFDRKPRQRKGVFESGQGIILCRISWPSCLPQTYFEGVRRWKSPRRGFEIDARRVRALQRIRRSDPALVFCVSINYLQSHFVEKEWGWWEASELCGRHQICVAGIDYVVAGIGIVTFRRRDALSRNARPPISWQKRRDKIARKNWSACME